LGRKYCGCLHGNSAREKVLLITDEPMAIIRQHLTERIAEIGPAELWAYTVPDAVRPLPHYPDLLYKVAEQADAVLSFEHRRTPKLKPGARWKCFRPSNVVTRGTAPAHDRSQYSGQRTQRDYHEIAALTNRPESPGRAIRRPHHYRARYRS